MAEIILIRHSMTKGNLEGRYIGCRTDEPLCEEGIRLLKSRPCPKVERIYASPMRRCVETAQIIWGFCRQAEEEDAQEQQIPVILVSALRECDFGNFENKNYQELNQDSAYQAWIDSGGTLPFPGGESAEAFKTRCRTGFAELVREITELEEQLPADGKKRAGIRAALVVHGGTIMAVLERFGYPKKNYFDYQVKNGCGYVLTPVEGTDLWNYQCWP